jgi:hypothetical protein
MSSLEQTNSRMMSKIDTLDQLSEILEDAKIRANVTRLGTRYQCTIAPIISEYYAQRHDDALTVQYYKKLSSENIVARLDQLFSELSIVMERNREKKTINNGGPGLIVATRGRPKGGSKTAAAVVSALGGNTVREVKPLNATSAAIVNMVEKAEAAAIEKQKQAMIERLATQYVTFNVELPNYLTINRTDMCPSGCIGGQGGATTARGTMILYPEDSELRCEKCGHVETIAGTIFDDNQCYSHDNKSVSLNHKRHDPNLHCTKWLYQLQAKETKNISASIIAAIDARAIKEYTINGVLRPMTNLSCRRIRTWLKEMRLAKLNNHIPLLRRLVTGLHGEAVVPPTLTVDEEMKILQDFALIVAIFDEISKKKDVLARFQKNKIHNKLYYPYMLMKILAHHLAGDSRYIKLIEGIHLQSVSTIIKDDYIWKQICVVLQERGKKYVYSPTDRGAMLAVFG